MGGAVESDIAQPPLVERAQIPPIMLRRAPPSQPLRRTTRPCPSGDTRRHRPTRRATNDASPRRRMGGVSGQPRTGCRTRSRFTRGPATERPEVPHDERRLLDPGADGRADRAAVRSARRHRLRERHDYSLGGLPRRGCAPVTREADHPDPRRASGTHRRCCPRRAVARVERSQSATTNGTALCAAARRGEGLDGLALRIRAEPGAPPPGGGAVVVTGARVGAEGADTVEDPRSTVPLTSTPVRDGRPATRLAGPSPSCERPARARRAKTG